MFKRQKTGSVVCASCGSLVGVNDERCYSCGRRNPGSGASVRCCAGFGNDWASSRLSSTGARRSTPLTLLADGRARRRRHVAGGVIEFSSPDQYVTLAFGAAARIPVFGDGMWWTVLSAGWLHGSALHILFNMMWVRQLGPADRGCLRRRPDGHHLHDLERRRLPPEQRRRLLSCRDADPVPRRRAVHPGRLGRRSSGCSARWCTTAGAAAAA